jgi:glycosyltransferase involved in cell wall biosynthesis
MSATSPDGRPKVCLVVATPLTIHFFFRKFVVALAEWADVTLVFNEGVDTEVQPLALPADIIALPIGRRIAPFRDLVCLVKLFGIFRSRQFDLVITLVPKAGLLASLAAMASRVPVRLHIFQGEVWSSKSGLLRLILKTCDRITAAASTALLAVSASEKTFLLDEKVVAPKYIEVLGQGSISGVDTALFRPDGDARREWRTGLGIEEDDRLILFLGRINRDKGVGELIDAGRRLLRDFSDVKIAFVGPDEENLMLSMESAFGNQMGTRVICPGLTRTPEKWLNAADVLVLPSHREGFGVVALEAAACEIPVVSTRIHGLTDAIVDGVTGILVPPGNVDALHEALSALLAQPELRARLGREGRMRAVAEFEQDVVVKRYVDFVSELLGR